MQCLVNSLTHLGHPKEGDSSINVWWLGPLQFAAWGENWHKNHHSFAGPARLGLHWWQTDIGWDIIYGLGTIGLARHVKRPELRKPRFGTDSKTNKSPPACRVGGAR